MHHNRINLAKRKAMEPFNMMAYHYELQCRQLLLTHNLRSLAIDRELILKRQHDAVFYLQRCSQFTMAPFPKRRRLSGSGRSSGLTMAELRQKRVAVLSPQSQQPTLSPVATAQQYLGSIMGSVGSPVKSLFGLSDGKTVRFTTPPHTTGNVPTQTQSPSNVSRQGSTQSSLTTSPGGLSTTQSSTIQSCAAQTTQSTASPSVGAALDSQSTPPSSENGGSILPSISNQALRQYGHQRVITSPSFGHKKSPALRPRTSHVTLYSVPETFRGFESVCSVTGKRKRPPTDKVFPRSICPYSGQRKCDLVELAFRTLEELYSIKFCKKVKKAGKTLSFNFKNYILSNASSIIVLLIHGVANGFTSSRSRRGNSMTEFKDYFSDDAELMEHYEKMMWNVLVYFFEYCVPRKDHGYLLTDVLKKTVPAAIQTCKQQRLKHRLWSCEYIEGEMFALGQQNSNLCKGHNYHVALIYDRIIDGGITKDISFVHEDGRHHLTDLQLQQWFESNESSSFWDRSGIATPTDLHP